MKLDVNQTHRGEKNTEPLSFFRKFFFLHKKRVAGVGFLRLRQAANGAALRGSLLVTGTLLYSFISPRSSFSYFQLGKKK